MDNTQFFIYLAIVAGVTYLIRMLPLAFFKNKITNDFFKSFLYYVPFAVLAAMTFPAIFTSTGSIESAIAGLICAVVLSFMNRGLVTVAVSACAVALVVRLIMG